MTVSVKRVNLEIDLGKAGIGKYENVMTVYLSGILKGTFKASDTRCFICVKFFVQSFILMVSVGKLQSFCGTVVSTVRSAL